MEEPRFVLRDNSQIPSALLRVHVSNIYSMTLMSQEDSNVPIIRNFRDRVLKNPEESSLSGSVRLSVISDLSIIKRVKNFVENSTVNGECNASTI